MNCNLLKIAAFAAALLTSAAALAQDAAKGSADSGKVTYNKTCYTCHGTTGQGAAATGPRIGPTAMPFDAFVQQVRQPYNQMVPYPPTVLNDQDLADIYAYLQSQKKEDFKQIPLLSQSE